ncbi:MAG: AAA family ATPase [Candidatus Absconditicoccaceae bacterium]
MGRFDNYDNLAGGVIKNTYKFAQECGHNPADVNHLFYVMLNQSNKEIIDLLTKVGADIDAIKNTTQKELYGLLAEETDFGISPSLNQVYIDSEKIIKNMGDTNVSIYHMFLSLLNSKNSISKMLNQQGITFEKMKVIIEAMPKAKLRSDEINTSLANSASGPDMLNKYSEDLVSLAKQGKLKEVIGREKELEKMIEILCRKDKNNILILGDSGVGKTSLAELLAQKISTGEVPDDIKNKTILRINLGSIVAGTKFRGEFEEKISGIIKTAKDSDGKIILFIDGFHNIVGAGKAEGSMGLSEMLVPELSRGNIQVIGVTTTSEYRQKVESDTTLISNFETLTIKEPSIQDTITILRGIEGSFEKHHGVTIYDTALVAAAELSNRYITDSKLPAKAIDIIDQASTKVKISMTSLPSSILEISIKIGQLEKENISITQELSETKDKLTKSELNKRLQTIKEEIDKLQSSYNTSKVIRDQMKKLSEENKVFELQVVELQKQSKNIEIKSESEQASKLNLEISEIQKNIQSNKESISVLQLESGIIIKNTVEVDDIAKVISEKTGIPLAKMLTEESEKLANLESYLSTKVIGQSEAIAALSDAIRRARVGLKDPKKPIGSFIFLGNTGVGKTELAKALAEFLFSDKTAMVRLNMSEYQGESSTSKLIGSDPGLVGYEQGGQLTEPIRRKPYSVVLLDEVEKAHPKVFDMFLQVFDDGILNDSMGNTIDFKNTIIIMTSNIGSREIMENFKGLGADIGDLYPVDVLDQEKKTNSEDVQSKHKRNRRSKKNNNPESDQSINLQTEELKEQLEPILMDFFRPELLNRLDDKIIFNPMSQEMFKGILEIKFKEQINLIYSTNKITLNISNKAKNFLAKKGRDPANGARPIDRALKKYLISPLAKEIVSGNLHQGDIVNVDVENEKLIFQKELST